MQDWFPQSDTQEDADLDGEPVTRVTGKLDLSAALTDLKELAKRPGMSGAEGLKELSNGDIKRIERMFSDPSFTLDVGRDDGKLRRIVATMQDGRRRREGRDGVLDDLQGRRQARHDRRAGDRLGQADRGARQAARAGLRRRARGGADEEIS